MTVKVASGHKAVILSLSKLSITSKNSPPKLAHFCNQFKNVKVNLSFGQNRGEHFPEFAKNHWGKVPNSWDLGKSSMKFNSARVVAIWDGEVLTTFLNVRRNSTQLKGIVSHDEGGIKWKLSKNVSIYA